MKYGIEVKDFDHRIMSVKAKQPEEYVRNEARESDGS